MPFEGNCFLFLFSLDERFHSILHADGDDPVERGETDDARERIYRSRVPEKVRKTGSRASWRGWLLLRVGTPPV